MEHSTTESMNEENQSVPSTEELDALLSMRGKPFTDWKEERKYLREKWGRQGKIISPEESAEKNQGSKQAKEESQ